MPKMHQNATGLACCIVFSSQALSKIKINRTVSECAPGNNEHSLCMALEHAAIAVAAQRIESLFLPRRLGHRHPA